MFKKAIFPVLIFFSLILNFPRGYSEQTLINHLHYSSELSGILSKVRRLPEVNDLLSKVLQDGPLYIEVNHIFPDDFDGYWSSSERTIYITKTAHSSNCFLVTALVFELHNAARDSDLEAMNQLASNRRIERNKFIEAVEYIEYENARATSLILKKGAKRAIFSADCSWQLSDNFQQHLYLQKVTGHSAWIGKIYDYYAFS